MVAVQFYHLADAYICSYFLSSASKLVSSDLSSDPEGYEYQGHYQNLQLNQL